MLSTVRFCSFFDCGGEVKVHATYKSICESINHVTSKPPQKCLTLTDILQQPPFTLLSPNCSYEVPLKR